MTGSNAAFQKFIFTGPPTMPHTILIVTHKYPLGDKKKTPQGNPNIYVNSGYFLSYLKRCHTRKVMLLLGVKTINTAKRIFRLHDIIFFKWYVTISFVKSNTVVISSFPSAFVCETFLYLLKMQWKENQETGSLAMPINAVWTRGDPFQSASRKQDEKGKIEFVFLSISLRIMHNNGSSCHPPYTKENQLHFQCQ